MPPWLLKLPPLLFHTATTCGRQQHAVNVGRRVGSGHVNVARPAHRLACSERSREPITCRQSPRRSCTLSIARRTSCSILKIPVPRHRHTPAAAGPGTPIACRRPAIAVSFTELFELPCCQCGSGTSALCTRKSPAEGAHTLSRFQPRWRTRNCGLV